MLIAELTEIFLYITAKTGELVSRHVSRPDLTGKADFASVYAHSPEEFDRFTQDLKANGEICLARPTGDYYWLNESLQSDIGLIRRCRIRKPDNMHPERGYCDFETVDFPAFKLAYLNKPGFILISKTIEEMMELKDANFPVRAYFPNTEF